MFYLVKEDMATGEAQGKFETLLNSVLDITLWSCMFLARKLDLRSIFKLCPKNQVNVEYE